MSSNADAQQQMMLAELDRVASRSSATTATTMAAENFPVAMRILPARPRDLLARAYTFARFVDDLGDAAAGDRLALLDAAEADVRALPSGAATLPPVRGIAPVLDCATGLAPFLDLIEANRVDQRVSRYETFDDLLDYCRLSAAPVGRIVLAVAGVSDNAAALRSDRACAALQVLEHCQDVGEDARAGRIYLPAVELRAAGVTEAELRMSTTSPALRAVVAAQVSRAEAMLRDGAVLARGLRGWARLAVAGYVGGGRATASALRRGDFDVLARSLRPSRLGTAGHAARLVVGR